MEFKHEECKWFYKANGKCKCGLNPTAIVLDNEQPLCVSFTLIEEIWEERNGSDKPIPKKGEYVNDSVKPHRSVTWN